GGRWEEAPVHRHAVQVLRDHQRRGDPAQPFDGAVVALRRDGHGSAAPLRVCEIINTDRWAWEFLAARALQANAAGIRSEIVCADGPAVARLRAVGLRIHMLATPRRVAPLAMLVAGVRLLALLRRERFDL